MTIKGHVSRQRFGQGLGLVLLAFALALFCVLPLKADPIGPVPFARPVSHNISVPAHLATPTPAPARVSGRASLQIAELDQTAYAAPPDGPIPDDAAAPASTPVLANISGIRLGEHGAETRFVIEMTGANAVKYQVFTLANPYRVVIDMHDTGSTMPDVVGIKGHGAITSYRYGAFQNNVFRIVIDAASPVKIVRDFTLDPQSGFGRRVVLDLTPTDPISFMASLSVPSTSQPVVVPSTPVVPSNPEDKKTRRRIVVIDPGHGGIDPGTHGRSGALEKDVVLAFGKELAKRLRATGRYDVSMTRDRDIFIPLRERVAIAHRRNADLFISIHADSISKLSVSGMSVYTLSETASDKEAAALARKENLSDAIAGIDFRGESPEVAGILIDLAQRETKNYSSRFARSVVNHARGETPLLEPTHRFAGFVVLKAPDVPSVLIELGFLTNRSDERNLTSPRWRTKVATSFVSAVNRYFGDRSAEGPN